MRTSFQRGLMAAATTSNKPLNQDAFAMTKKEHPLLAGVVVADGLGSHFGAEIAATVVARVISEELDVSASRQVPDMQRVFAKAWRSIGDHVDAHSDGLPADLDWQNAFGTTALCAVETIDALTMAYVGNGGIFHLRGNFNTFPKSQLLPWSALNYLNPHTIPRDGKNAMYKLVAPRSGPSEISPTVMTMSKDESYFGDIIVCCTDGIYSYDQVEIGLDDQRRVWISGEASVSRLFEALNGFFEGELTDEALAKCLNAYLANLKSSNLVTDDCTIGLLITQKALEYQMTLRARRGAAA